jgi:hypothetical protein
MENESDKQNNAVKIDQNTFEYMIKSDQIIVIFIKNNKWWKWEKVVCAFLFVSRPFPANGGRGGGQEDCGLQLLS